MDDITCRELVELVTDYLEGHLLGADLTRFEEHLEICEDCRVYVDQIRQSVTLAGKLEPEPLDPEARDALVASFRDWKRARSP